MTGVVVRVARGISRAFIWTKKNHGTMNRPIDGTVAVVDDTTRVLLSSLKTHFPSLKRKSRVAGVPRKYADYAKFEHNILYVRQSKIPASCVGTARKKKTTYFLRTCRCVELPWGDCGPYSTQELAWL